MVEWSPDKTKNCKECQNWYEDYEHGEFGTTLSYAEYCHLLHKIRIISHSDDICNEKRELNYPLLIANLFESLEMERDDNGCMFLNETTQEFEFDEDFYNEINIFIANICPLYKEKKEKSESFECTGRLCEYYHEVCRCDLNNNTKDCALIRGEKGVPKEE